MLLKDKIDKKAAWERRFHLTDAEKRKGCLHVCIIDHRCGKVSGENLEKEKAKWEASDDE